MGMERYIKQPERETGGKLAARSPWRTGPGLVAALLLLLAALGVTGAVLLRLSGEPPAPRIATPTPTPAPLARLQDEYTFLIRAHLFPDYEGVRVSVTGKPGDRRLMAFHPLFNRYTLVAGKPGRSVRIFVADNQAMLKEAGISSVGVAGDLGEAVMNVR
jgi:hypothetical protein